MIPQKPRSALTPEKAARRDAMKKAYIDHLDSRNVDAASGRRGILKMTEPSGKERDIRDHQFVAAYNLWSKDLETKPEQGKKAGLLCVHDTGFGKTITAILMIAGIFMALRNPSDALHIVVCGKSVLPDWFNTCVLWLDLPEIFMAEHQSEITADVLKRTRILITTPSVLIEAYKSFMWWDPQGEAYHTKAGALKHRGGYCHGVSPSASTRRKAQFKRRRPPVHPLFQYMADRVSAGKFAFATVVIDEVHGCSNPKRWSGHILGKLCEDAVYTVGLTATPVRARPEQAAHIAQTLNLQPASLRDPKEWTIPGSKDGCLRQTTVRKFQEEAVDRAGSETVDLVPIKWVRLSYDPFVGRTRTGGYNREQQARHDSRLRAAEAQTEAAVHTNTYRGAFDTWLWQVLTTMTQFTFDATLGMYGAEAFNKEPEIYYKLARRQPSEAVRLIWRMLRDRQSKGHPRIVVYSASSVMLTILRNYVSRTGHCGKLFLFTGKLTKAQERKAMVSEFLSAENPKGVLFMSDAGKEGMNVCPGCDTIFIVGDVPWNSADIDQAKGRIHRITQDQNVEVVQFEPRRSVISAKLNQHIDKRDRLERAIRDEDFSNFSGPPEDADPSVKRWKLTTEQMRLGLARPDEDGNYKLTLGQNEVKAEWEQQCAHADLVGQPRPEKPESICIAEAVLADDVELPPISWPKEGCVPVDVETDDEHEALSERVRKVRPTEADDADDERKEEAKLQSMLSNSKAAHKQRKFDEKLAARVNVLKGLAQVDDYDDSTDSEHDRESDGEEAESAEEESDAEDLPVRTVKRRREEEDEAAAAAARKAETAEREEDEALRQLLSKSKAARKRRTLDAKMELRTQVLAELADLDHREEEEHSQDEGGWTSEEEEEADEATMETDDTDDDH